MKSAAKTPTRTRITAKLTAGIGAALLGLTFLSAAPAQAAPQEAPRAQAAGACSSTTTSGEGPASIVATCENEVTFVWRCSSDLFFRYNSRVVDYGPGFKTQSFVACDWGYPRDIRVNGAAA